MWGNRSPGEANSHDCGGSKEGAFLKPNTQIRMHTQESGVTLGSHQCVSLLTVVLLGCLEAMECWDSIWQDQLKAQAEIDSEGGFMSELNLGLDLKP